MWAICTVLRQTDLPCPLHQRVDSRRSVECPRVKTFDQSAILPVKCGPLLFATVGSCARNQRGAAHFGRFLNSQEQRQNQLKISFNQKTLVCDCVRENEAGILAEIENERPEVDITVAKPCNGQYRDYKDLLRVVVHGAL